MNTEPIPVGQTQRVRVPEPRALAYGGSMLRLVVVAVLVGLVVFLSTAQLTRPAPPPAVNVYVTTPSESASESSPGEQYVQGLLDSPDTPGWQRQILEDLDPSDLGLYDQRKRAEIDSPGF